MQLASASPVPAPVGASAKVHPIENGEGGNGPEEDDDNPEQALSDLIVAGRAELKEKPVTELGKARNAATQAKP